MAIYEYRCPVCEERFSRLRPMAEADDETVCSAGHPARRLISVVAGMTGANGAEPAVTSNGGRAAGGGCCGGSCGCR